jgi:hypothetical protein
LKRPISANLSYLIVVMVLGLISAPGVHAQPSRQSAVVGNPAELARYWHDQRWTQGDFYACALYAQASVLEALGYDFAAELSAARVLGQRDGWYVPDVGAIGLGQPLRAKGISFNVFGTPVGGRIPRWLALFRLLRGVAAGDYVIINLDATRLSYYRGSAITWHTIWVTGLRLDERGRITTVIANDSYHSAAVEYPVGEILDGWGHERLNYYAIFVHPPA